MNDDVPQTQHAHLIEAAHAVAHAGLVDAFGHLSVRSGATTALVTPPVPLGSLGGGDASLVLDAAAADLPAGAPKEAWIHVAVYAARPDVGAICRAQPPAVAAFAALGIRLPALGGHGAMLGDVAVFPDSRLVRDRAAGDAVAAALGSASAVILRGNGALTVGTDLAEAVARMWVLERTADLALRALAAGEPVELPSDERAWWRDRATELLPRIYRYLTTLP